MKVHYRLLLIVVCLLDIVKFAAAILMDILRIFQSEPK